MTSTSVLNTNAGDAAPAFFQLRRMARQIAPFIVQDHNRNCSMAYKAFRDALSVEKRKRGKLVEADSRETKAVTENSEVIQYAPYSER